MTRAQGQVQAKELNKTLQTQGQWATSVQSACTTVIKMLIEAVVPASPHKAEVNKSGFNMAKSGTSKHVGTLPPQPAKNVSVVP